jgi:hypothetical protein
MVVVVGSRYPSTPGPARSQVSRCGTSGTHVLASPSHVNGGTFGHDRVSAVTASASRRRRRDCQSRRERHSTAASATVTMDTARPVIQPATLAAIRIAPSAVPTPTMPAVATRRAKTDSKVRRSGRSDKNPLLTGVSSAVGSGESASTFSTLPGVRVIPVGLRCLQPEAVPTRTGGRACAGPAGRSQTWRIAVVFLIERPDARVFRSRGSRRRGVKTAAGVVEVMKSSTTVTNRSGSSQLG